MCASAGHPKPIYSELCLKCHVPAISYLVFTAKNKTTARHLHAAMPFTSLPSKPQAELAYNYIDNGSDILVAFINGLGLPAASWANAISLVGGQKPNFLTYDRFGQGQTTARDPADDLPGKQPGYGHDLNDIVEDLHGLLEKVVPGRPRIILVSASIGVHVARLYDQRYPGKVAAHLMLDSNIANLTTSDILPDPDAAGFDEGRVLADDCTLQQYRDAYARAALIFNPGSKNPEGLDRRGIKALLPEASAPALSSFGGRAPWLTVAGHEPTAFAVESEMLMKVPQSVTMKFTQQSVSPPLLVSLGQTAVCLQSYRRVWEKYNEELLKLGASDRTTGVVFAPKASHFIQKDNPQFVATQVEDLLSKVRNDE